MEQTLRQMAGQIMIQALAAVQPDAAVRSALEQAELSGRVYLVAIGKAAWQMANAAYQTLGARITDGVVITKHGHSRGAIGSLAIFEAGHPVADAASFAATRQALALTERLTAEDTVLFLVSDILLYRTMVRTEQRVQLEVENELLERQLDAQLAHYRDLTAQYEQIRAMRHDISHHLNTINALLQAGNLQAASEYSEQLLPAQTYSSRLGACRNPVVDAFLYTRVQDAQAKGVPVRADVSLPVELPVSNTDLIVAFGNLLDNALEACSGIPDAQITLRAHMDKGYLVIQESNPVRPRQPQGKKPRRIPELERGVGFRVLGSLAAKYDGSFRHTCENDTYTVTLSLRAG